MGVGAFVTGLSQITSFFSHICLCTTFLDLSASVGCLSLVSKRRIIHKFVILCPFDYTAVVDSWKVGYR